MDEWIAYLNAYEQHLDAVEDSLRGGRVVVLAFAHPQPSSRLPRDLKARSEALVVRTEALSDELRDRMTAFSTVLRYSRMKDPSRIVLIDVLA